MAGVDDLKDSLEDDLLDTLEDENNPDRDENESSVDVNRMDAVVAAAGAGGAPHRPRIQNTRPRATLMEREIQGVETDRVAIMVRRQFGNFLESFRLESESESFYYVDQLDDMENSDSTTLVFDWLHLAGGADSMDENPFHSIADAIQSEFYRFEPYLCQAIQNFVRSHKPNYVRNTGSTTAEDKDFHVAIMNFPDVDALRDLKTVKIGQLCSVSGTVTRTTEVRPELVFGTFQCMECGTTIKYVPQQFKYTEPTICTNGNCQNRKTFTLDVESSKFVDWQKARVQESSNEIPAGSMPRSIDIILRGESVERCKPGDESIFTGTLIVVPDVGQFYAHNPVMMRQRQKEQAGDGVTGIRALGVRELNYKMVFLANFVRSSHGKTDLQSFYPNPNEDDRKNREEDNILPTLTDEERREIVQMRSMPRLYERLAASIAPNIYGQDDVKRGILLMLFGGVAKSTKDGVKLRGDINVCIIGDPSTAKSQFLQYVTRLLPRTVYTSGKASTAAGLTAAVMRDPETGEFGVEAGALMLADTGICCIDEFDKMDAMDVAAIHEAMEQQTITITKAGIQATLNARASILAAANPMWGRYDTSKSLRANVNISAPIMSRFDLFYIVLDECDEVADYNVAQHIVKMHSEAGRGTYRGRANDHADFTSFQIQRYIRVARTVKPRITPEAHKLLVKCYRDLRQRDQTEQKAYRITVRQLESLIRLSEALARVHLDYDVTERYVQEAARLLKQSIIAIDSPDIAIFEDDLPPSMGDVSSQTDKETEKKSENADKSGETVNVTYQYYIRTANLIVYHVRRGERSVHSGMRQGDLEERVLEELMDDGDDDLDAGNLDAMNRELKILKFVIRRLINTDRILVLKKNADKEEDRIIMVHPNYDADSGNTDNLDEMSPSVPSEEEAGGTAQASATQKKRKSPITRGKRRLKKRVVEEAGGSRGTGDDADMIDID